VLRLIRIGRLLAERVPCEVVIAGKDHDYYFALREELGGPIRYVGEVNDSTKRDLMLNASYVVLLSDYEGYGMPVAEANALGVPVLTSLGTVMTEMCSDSDCIVDISWPDEKIAANVFEHWRAGPHLKQPKARLWPDVAAEFINHLSDEHYFDHYSLQKH
jgi:glycosyltransferase involved in cell wall biosynthesis